MLALEKVIAAFLSLPGLFILLWLIVTVHLIVKSRSTFIKLLAVFSLCLMALTFTGLGTRITVIPLEKIYQQPAINEDLPIVVMGGGINYIEDQQAVPGVHTLQRLLKGWQLHQKTGGVVIYSGGVAIGQQGLSEAKVAGEWLQEMGVPVEKIVIENLARTTYENGVYIRKWLTKESDQNRVYLVSSAIHLPRSVMVFRKQGITAIPVPAGYLTDHHLSWLSYLPNAGSLNANLAAAHEWLGILWYKISGRI